MDITVAIGDQCEAESSQKVIRIISMAVFVHQLIEVEKLEKRWGENICLCVIVEVGILCAHHITNSFSSRPLDEPPKKWEEHITILINCHVILFSISML